MSNETCPHCGAESKFKNAAPFYECGTGEYSHTRSGRCCQRQLATQAAEIERLKQEMSECRECSLRIMRGEVK